MNELLVTLSPLVVPTGFWIGISVYHVIKARISDDAHRSWRKQVSAAAEKCKTARKHLAAQKTKCPSFSADRNWIFERPERTLKQIEEFTALNPIKRTFSFAWEIQSTRERLENLANNMAELDESVQDHYHQNHLSSAQRLLEVEQCLDYAWALSQNQPAIDELRTQLAGFFREYSENQGCWRQTYQFERLEQATQQAMQKPSRVRENI